MKYKSLAKFSPGRTILLSLFSVIAIGTLLLTLPFARNTFIPFTDLFFTSTSATCVTGLFTVPMENFTRFGHFIIMLLIQVGGLGLMTMSLFVISLFTDLGLAAQFMAGKILQLETWKNIRKMLLFIIIITLASEAIGAILLFTSFRYDYPLSEAIFMSVFHSISAFCNSGINLLPHGIANYSHSYKVLSTIGILMFCGGIGFVTWHEIFSHLKSPNWKRKISFSLHSKIVLRTAIALTLFFTVLFWLLERNSTLANMSPGLAIVNSIFNSIGARSAGFVTIPIVNLQLASILIVLVACFIGSAPGSTGSGIKTTTFSIFMSTLKSAITGKLAVEMYGRTIPRHQVLKAFAVLALSISWIIFAVFCLLITERSWSFLTVLFEVVSAFSTLGLSMLGKTADFTLTGKLILVITMIIGRIGPLTTVLALKKPSEKQEFSYPEERVMIG